jgi:lambda repressor-like predicted transcriptional regulator
VTKNLPVAELAQRYLDGESVMSLAKTAGVSQQTLCRRFRAAGIAVDATGSKKVRLPAEVLAERYLSGEGLSDLAADAGVSYQTIRRRLEQAGVPIRGPEKTELARNRMSEARRAGIPEDRLRELHAQRLSSREIGTILGFCEEAIRARLIELGLARLPAKARPEKNHFWQGGYAVDEDGYILQHCPDHPNAVSGYVRQHRLVMEKVLGRYLTPEEVVDHRNRDTSDNDPGNLELYPSNAAHLAATLTGVKLPREERERLKQEAVLRGRRRVAAILAASGTGAGQ